MGYESQKATTLKLLTSFGKSVVLNREDSGGVYDPVAGTTSGGSTLNLNGVGVLLNYNGNEIDGTNILAVDRKMLYTGDALSIGDKYNGWNVHNIKLLDPDESGTILTTVQLRK